MIITKNILNEKVPIEMMPTRLDSAMNLYTNVNFHGKDGIVLYNINPSTWNCLYSFYELNHKFTVDNYVFSKENITYRELIEEYKKVYKKIYEEEKGNIKERRIKTLSNEFIKTFDLNKVTIKEELTPIFELKFSKSKKVWTLYYFENYVASNVDLLDTLFHQKLYEQKILPLDFQEKEIDGIEIATNIQYLLSIKDNIEKIKNNSLKLE